MPRGRKPDTARRRQAAELRRAGLTLQEIGERLGITHQGAHHLLRPKAQAKPFDLRCAACGVALDPAGARPKDAGKALCLACLARAPAAPFWQRLKSYRLAAGLTRARLADRAGLLRSSIGWYEDAGRVPRMAALAALAAVLGVSVRDLGTEQLAGQGRGRPRKGK